MALEAHSKVPASTEADETQIASDIMIVNVSDNALESVFSIARESGMATIGVSKTMPRGTAALSHGQSFPPSTGGSHKP